MNNFAENESTITEIDIINPSEGIKNYKKINVGSLDIFLNPEGNSLVNGISNTIGIQVKDCNGNTPKNLEVTLISEEGELLKSINLNQFGYGKFEIVPTKNRVKAVLNYGGRTIEKYLQTSHLIGVSIEADAFIFDDKIALKIKTNQESYKTFLSKKLSLVIHQDQKVATYPIIFSSNKLEQVLLINKKGLNDGINTIRIIDEESQQWAERLIFINPAYSNSINIMKNGRKDDKINFIGYAQAPGALLSISVLPEETKSIGENNHITAGIKINPYITNPLKNANYYFSDQNRQKLYELDLVLLNIADSKYSWEYMKINPPESKFSFDIGLSVKGRVGDAIKNKTRHQVKLLSAENLITVMSKVSDKGEYLFENLLLTDSTSVNLSLQKLPDFEAISEKLLPIVINRNRLFSKPFTNFINNNCIENFVFEKNIDFQMAPFDKKTTNLDEIVLKDKKKEELKFSQILSNRSLRGIKIGELESNMDLVYFIIQNGFEARREIGKFEIYSRRPPLSGRPPATPLVLINDRQIYRYDELEFMRMSDIDEVYIDPFAMVGGGANNEGIIKIYTKIQTTNYTKGQKDTSFFIKGAFSPIVIFKDPDFNATQNRGFDNFGAIGWSSDLRCNDQGDFIFEFIDLKKSKYKVVLEGITNDGKLIREEKIIE